MLPVVNQLPKIPAEHRISVGFAADGWTDYEAYIADASEESPFVKTVDDDECVIIYSSGTTGVPKGIVHTQKSRNLMALGGAVGLLYALTHKLPAIKSVTRSDGQQGTAIVLASPTEARASWARYGGELRGAMLEVKARRQAQ